MLAFNSYGNYRKEVIESHVIVKVAVDYGKTTFVYFTYCSSIKTFRSKFNALWNKYFGDSPINEVVPVLGTRNVKNLQRRLIDTRSIDTGTEVSYCYVQLSFLYCYYLFVSLYVYVVKCFLLNSSFVSKRINWSTYD